MNYAYLRYLDDFFFTTFIETAARIKYTTINTIEMDQWTLIPNDIERMIVTISPPIMFIKFILSNLDTTPLNAF